jgi:aspartate/methionine/tyrosine aminotransferase
VAFDTTDYLSWYVPRIRRGDDALNLHASGVVPLEPDDLDVPEGNPWLMAPAFESALARRLGCPPEQLLFTPGATGGTLLALLTLVDRDRELVVESPIYEPMLRQAERLNPVRRLPRDPARTWRFDLEEARRLVTERTGLVMLTEPHNPSGLLSPREDVLALAEHAAHAGALVLINEVYHGWSEAPSYHGATPNILVVSSLSKLLGAYWARLGWISGDKSQVGRLRTAHMNFGMASAPSAAVGLAVLEKLDALTERARAAAREGISVVDRWVRATPGVSWHRPASGGFGCVALPAGVDDMALAETLHDEHGVLVVPGTLWDLPGTVRISWLQADRSGVAQGLQRLARLLAD